MDCMVCRCLCLHCYCCCCWCKYIYFFIGQQQHQQKQEQQQHISIDLHVEESNLCTEDETYRVDPVIHICDIDNVNCMHIAATNLCLGIGQRE